MAASVGLAACAPQTGQDPPPTTTTTTLAMTTTTPATAHSEWPNGPVEPGTYHVASSAWSVADVTITIPPGWESEYGAPAALKHSDQEEELGFYFVTVDAIYSDPCQGEGELIDVGPSVDDMAKALLEQPFTVANEPEDTTLGGLPAEMIELTVPDDLDTAACRMGELLQVWYSPPTDKYLVLLGDGTTSVYIVDVKGERQVFITWHRTRTTAADLNEMQTIVESIKIDE